MGTTSLVTNVCTNRKLTSLSTRGVVFGSSNTTDTSVMGLYLRDGDATTGVKTYYEAGDGTGSADNTTGGAVFSMMLTSPLPALARVTNVTANFTFSTSLTSVNHGTDYSISTRMGTNADPTLLDEVANLTANGSSFDPITSGVTYSKNTGSVTTDRLGGLISSDVLNNTVVYVYPGRGNQTSGGNTASASNTNYGLVRSLTYTVTYDEAPSAANVFPTSGIVATHNPRPTITWDYVDDNTVVQLGFRVQIYNVSTGTTVIDSSNQTSSSTSWTPASDLPAYGDYKVRVQVRQAWSGPGGIFVGAYTTSTGTLRYQANNAPTVSGLDPSVSSTPSVTSLPYFSWAYSDDKYPQKAFQIQVYNASLGPTAGLLQDSGVVSATGTSTSESFSWRLSTPMAFGVEYKTRIMVQEMLTGGAIGTDQWSNWITSTGTILFSELGPQFIFPNTILGQTTAINSSSLTATWNEPPSLFLAPLPQYAYQIRLVRVSDSAIIEDSGEVISGNYYHTFSTSLVLGEEYLLRIRTRETSTATWTDYQESPGYFTSYSQDFINQASPGFRSMSQMLLGGVGGSASAWAPDDEDGVYTWAANALAANPNRPIFVLAGSYESHSRYNDFTGGLAGSTLKASEGSALSDGFDSVTNTGGAAYWHPTSISQVNPRDVNSAQQRGVRSNMSASPSGAEWFGRWELPTENVTTTSVSAYFRMGTQTAANCSGLALGIYSASNVLLGGIRINQTNGTWHYVNNGSKSSSGTQFGTGWSINTWYRLEVFYSIPTNTVTCSVSTINSLDSDTPATTSIYTAAPGALAAPSYVTVGNSLSSTSSAVTGELLVEYPKLSWDMQGAAASKAAWVADALTTRRLPRVKTLILMDGDYVQDVDGSHLSYATISDGGLFGRLEAWKNFGDTRLDSSKITADQVLRSLNGGVRNNERIHTIPQVYELGYQSSTNVSQLEYMYLSETGAASLYLYPRLNGILLLDVDLGIAAVRGVSEERAMNDGIRDFSRFVGSKAVTLNLLCFSDKAGSASYYSDVVSAWANPRRRVRLYYKMKDGVERYINLRPETTNGQWTVEGRRAGLKETILSFVGVDGKDYASEERNQLIQANTTTDIIVYGTAATPGKIRIFGGATGCLNPTVTLPSKETEDMSVGARLSLGRVGDSQIAVPAGQFIEIDLDARTAQLNGLPGNGNNYSRYLSERQWFQLETYVNSIYMTSSDSNGYAEVKWRDAYL